MLFMCVCVLRCSWEKGRTNKKGKLNKKKNEHGGSHNAFLYNNNIAFTARISAVSVQDIIQRGESGRICPYAANYTQ